MKKRLVSLLLAAVMVFSLAACSEQSGSSAAETKPAASTSAKPGESTKAPTTEAPATPPEPVVKKLSFIADNCSTLNPYIAGASEADYLSFCQATLYSLWTDAEGERYYRDELADGEPVMADSDGFVWDIKIKENACFSDGTPITAEVFRNSWKMLLDPLQLNRDADYFFTHITVKNAQPYFKGEEVDGKKVSWDDVGIEVMNEKMLRLTLATATTVDLVKLALTTNYSCPVDYDMFTAGLSADGTSTTYGDAIDHVKYSGAFVITEWAKESKLLLKKNPNYVYADEIHLDEAELVYVDNGMTRVLLFEDGKLDYTTLDADQGPEYADSPSYFTVPSPAVVYIDIYDGSSYYEAVNAETGEVKQVFNDPALLAQPILSNSNLKNALWYSVDRLTLAKLASGTPANYMIPYTSYCGTASTVRFRDLDLAKEYLEDFDQCYNPELAKEYLNKALAEIGADRVTLKLTISDDAADHVIAAQFLQEQYRKIFDDKLVVEIEGMTDQLRLEKVKGWRNNINAYELSLGQWNRSTSNTSPLNTMDVFSSSFWTKCNGPYHCETVEKLIWKQKTDANVKADPDANAKLAAEMEKALLADRAVIPLFERAKQYLVQEWVITNSENTANWDRVLFDVDTSLLP